MAPKMKRRIFRLENTIDQFGPDHPGPHKWTNEVIDGIENDEVRVFDPTDGDALSHVLNDAGEELIEARATVPVSIREWLPVACQCIRWSYDCDSVFLSQRPDALAWYDHNAAQVLWPQGSMASLPQGPAAFCGEIIIRGHDGPFDAEGAEGRFKCLMAHELVHAFHMLKLLVPAFINWRAFWHCVLDNGCACDYAQGRYADIGSFLDDYGNENEKLSIAQYWPSQIDAWWAAFREPKSRRSRKA